MGRAGARRRPATWLLFAAAAAAVVAVAAEAAAVLVWRALTGTWFSWSAAAAERRAAAPDGAGGGRPAAPALDAAMGRAALHPYLGYVMDPAPGHGSPYAYSSFGFVDDAPPLRRRAPDRFVVGITGGSVALLLALDGGEELAAALRASPALAGRQLDLVRLGLGGFKQPQQLLQVALLLALGGEFDCIVNLDGFNEVALADENVPLGVPEWYPRSWARLLDQAPSPQQLLRLGELALLRQRRAAAVAWGDCLWWSPLAQTVWWWRDRGFAAACQELVAAIERAPAQPGFALTGPGPSPSIEAARRRMVAIWQQSSLSLAALCRARGIVYLHCLQPNQHVPGAKPIGAEEAAAALDPGHPWAAAVRDHYPELVAAGAELAAAGVPFTDLTGVFRNHPEPLYSDRCCHLNIRGSRLLARHIAAGIRRQLDLSGAVIERLAAVPGRLRLDSPLRPQAVQVLGYGADGRQHDLSGVGLGVTYTAEPADGIEVLADGSVRARRRGRATLVAATGGAQVRIDVAAVWPDQFEADDGLPGPDGVLPRVVPEAQGAGAGLVATCVDLPAAALCLLAIGDRPLPDSPAGADATGLWIEPLPGGRRQVTIPRRAVRSGEPLFLRAYALAGDAVQVVARSPTLVLTAP